jgi:CRISPR system Cascade subunit CasB
MTNATTETSPSFASSAVQGPLYAWWESLEDRRGDRAELRRCRSLDPVMLTEAYHRFRKRMTKTGLTFREDQLAAVAGLLSHVQEHAPDQHELGTQMAGGESQDEKATVQGLRFRRLLQQEDREDLYRSLIRVVRLLDRRVNVGALARDVFYWGPSVRKRWARTYYEHALDEV